MLYSQQLMCLKQLILLVLLFVFCLCQITETSNLEESQNIDRYKQCFKGQENYRQKSGLSSEQNQDSQCLSTSSDSDQKLQIGSEDSLNVVIAGQGGTDQGDYELLCNDNSSCGQAQAFQNKSQFDKFVQKYTNLQQLNPFLTSNPFEQNKKQITGSQKDYKSQTNNQVQSIDESDLLKTDGQFIFTISDDVFSITDVRNPEEPRLINKIVFDDLFVRELFIQEDYLAIFSTKFYNNSYQTLTSTHVFIFDMSNKQNLIMVRNYTIGGAYLSGRKLKNGFVYIVSNYQISFSLGKMYPQYSFGQGMKQVPYNQIYYFPMVYNKPMGVNILSFNLRDPLQNQRKIITVCIQSSDLIYMSQKFLYLASSSQNKTIIRKIYVDKQVIKPYADAEVEGNIKTQFQMDQHNSHFRIATTSYYGNGITDTHNNIFVFNKNMKLIGSILGLAKQEKIYSCRFYLNKLYMVTFREIDPFFVIDLSNPFQPAVLGQLKIPGFSRYLQPYDQDTIIGFGRQQDNSIIPSNFNLKISIFNVSNVQYPTQTAKYVFQQNIQNSIAQYQHKAFLLSSQRNLLVLPIQASQNQAKKFNGAYVFFINTSSIVFKAKINHFTNKKASFLYQGVQRSLYIGDYLFTKSKCLVKINDMGSQFEEIGSSQIPCMPQNSFQKKKDLLIKGTPNLDGWGEHEESQQPQFIQFVIFQNQQIMEASAKRDYEDYKSNNKNLESKSKSNNLQKQKRK